VDAELTVVLFWVALAMFLFSLLYSSCTLEVIGGGLMAAIALILGIVASCLEIWSHLAN